MFGICKTLTSTARQPCTATLVSSAIALRGSQPPALHPDTVAALASSEKIKKNIIAFKRQAKALQYENYRLSSDNTIQPPQAPELVDFQGFLFKNRQKLIRLEEDAIHSKKMELIKSS